MTANEDETEMYDWGDEQYEDRSLNLCGKVYEHRQDSVVNFLARSEELFVPLQLQNSRVLHRIIPRRL